MKKVSTLLACLIVGLTADTGLSRHAVLLEDNLYLLGFEQFYSSAQQSKGNRRIVLVGGSSLGWGVSAEKLSVAVGVPVLNAGIHAGIGYENFFRVIANVVDKDTDLFVISPEYAVIGETKGAFSRSPEFCFVSLYVLREFSFGCAGYSAQRIATHPQVFFKRKKEKSDYRRDGFNSYGDYVYRSQRSFNPSVHEVCASLEITADRDRFISFIEAKVRSGFNIIYIPNFTPIGSCSTPEKLEEFHQIMHQKFGVPGFDGETLEFDEKYFYDTAYHLTKDGVEKKTQIFASQLNAFLDEHPERRH